MFIGPTRKRDLLKRKDNLSKTNISSTDPPSKISIDIINGNMGVVTRIRVVMLIGNDITNCQQ